MEHEARAVIATHRLARFIGKSGVSSSFRGEIRCQFVFSGKNDELTLDFAPDTGFRPRISPPRVGGHHRDGLPHEKRMGRMGGWGPNSAQNQGGGFFSGIRIDPLHSSGGTSRTSGVTMLRPVRPARGVFFWSP
jgi:hypothetical protein